MRFIYKYPFSIYLLLGLIARSFFTIVLAEAYFGRGNIYISLDTYAWLSSFRNLVDYGIYSTNLEHEYGAFGRMPGYSFFLGIFDLIFNRNVDLIFPVVGWFQILVDLFNIYLFFKIGQIVFKNPLVAHILALLYAAYPFVIVWTPIAYSESLSFFFLIASCYLFVDQKVKYRYFLLGASLGLGVLMRPQLALLVPLFGLGLLFQNLKSLPKLLLVITSVGLGLTITYGLWPLRNIIFQKKLVLTQNIKGFKNWDVDVMSYTQFIHAVQQGWEPQFTQIIKNKPVTFPDAVLRSEQDSALFAKAILLAQTCGEGFSHWRGYQGRYVGGDGCKEEIEQAFITLRSRFIQNYPLEFYLTIPLQNLKKALFKSQLSDTKPTIRKLASLLFYYRTILILLGIIGSILMLKNRSHFMAFHLIILAYFIIWYFTLCFVPWGMLRNIEMRYLVQADILLLIPASWLIAEVLQKLKSSLV